ncbi:Rib/alpha-like domain-containing protein, partial [Corynebacterium propinquum]
VAQGGNPDAAEGIANKGELPAGTEFEFDGPVDTSSVGEKSVKVIVAYPDGSTEAVEVTVQVAAGDQDLLPDADRYEPEAKDGVTTSEGETPEAGALIGNKGDLPAGTTFEWEIEPNVDVPGNTGGVVKVIYPDGSSETIAVELEVTEVPTDADGHDPQGQNLEVAEGGELDPADAITNKGELPE